MPDRPEYSASLAAGKPSLGRPATLGRLALLWLAGIDLRVTILAVPPVLPLIHRDLDLNETMVGALSGLPVLLFGMMAIPGSLVIARIGTRRALLAALLLVAVGSALRGVGPSVAMLFAMTFVMGSGIAVMQPALPALVGEWFPRSAELATAVYANGLLIGEALGAALTIPLVLPLVGESWSLSFLVWSVPVWLAALLIAAFTSESGGDGQKTRRLWIPDWRDGDTWKTGLILGGGSTIYFAANAFIPDYLGAIGRHDLIASSLASLNIGQLPASFLILFFARRLMGRRAPLVAIALLSLAGLVGLLAPSAWSVVLGAGVLGFCAAFVLILTLALPPLLGSHGDVHRLSAGMFTIGYVCAFIVPVIGGAAWDVTHVPASAFVPILLGAVVVLALSIRLRAPKARGAPD